MLLYVISNRHDVGFDSALVEKRTLNFETNVPQTVNECMASSLSRYIVTVSVIFIRMRKILTI